MPNIRNLSAAYAVPYYRTREEWQAAHPGVPMPTYDPTKQVKRWEDVNLSVGHVVNSKYVQYDRTVALTEDFKSQAQGLDNLPFIESLLISPEDAKTVNIPPTQAAYGDKEHPDTRMEVQVPLVPLFPGERLNWYLNGVVIENTTTETAEVGDGFTAADRTLLHAIATALKVGI